MKARDAYELAIAIADQIDENGQWSSYVLNVYELNVYKTINTIQKEIAYYEGKNVSKLSDLNEELKISDENATKVMPYGIAAAFFLETEDWDSYLDYMAMYRSLLRNIEEGTV